jgi:hypothetical protein
MPFAAWAPFLPSAVRKNFGRYAVVFLSGGGGGVLDVFARGGALFKGHDSPSLLKSHFLFLFLDSQFG